MKYMEVGVVGLGKFGMELAATLTELGHRVVGVDGSNNKVKAASEVIARAYQGDATDKALLDQLRFQDLDCVAVSVGNSMETSILVALNLSDLGVKNLVVKATSLAHRKVLTRIGVKHVVQPEVDAAIQTAHKMNNPGMLDFLPLGGGVLLQEVTVNVWKGRALAELNLTNTYGVMAVAKRKVGEKDLSFVPNPLEELEKGDILVLIGPPEKIQELEP